MKTNKINKKLRRMLCLVLAVSMLSTSIAPIAALAEEYWENQAAMQSVLNADLSAYGGERIAYSEDETNVDRFEYEPGNTLLRDSRYNGEPYITDAQEETTRFIIKYKSESSKESMESSMRNKVDIVSDFERTQSDTISVLTTRSVTTAKELELNFDNLLKREIEYIQPDYEMISYAQNGFSAQDIEGMTGTANDIIVALLDTGVDTNHPDLIGKLLPGYDFVNDLPTANDPNNYHDQGHGTGLAGVIVASGATVLPLKVFEGGKAYTSDIIAAIAYAEDNGAIIANCSWGSMFRNPALEEAMSESSMLFVCAAGNMLMNVDNFPVYPAGFGFDNILSVASLDAASRLSRFSNYGQVTVDIAVVGEKISTTGLDGRIVEISGTSVAAAIISASVAEVAHVYTGYGASDLKDRLIMSSDTITGLLDKIRDGKRMNLSYALSSKVDPNETVIDIPDDDPLPEITPWGIPEDDDYEEYGADDLVTFRASMPTARHGLGVVAVNGLIYAIGGQGGSSGSTYLKTVEVYDTSTDTWATKTNMNTARSYFGITVVNGKIYVMGGLNAGSAVEMYDPATDTWTAKAAMPVSLSAHTANEWNGNIYVAGGNYSNTVYKYDVTNNSWSNYGALSSVRLDHTAYVYDGKLWVGGGRQSTSSTAFACWTSESFDLTTKAVIPTVGYVMMTGLNPAFAFDGERAHSAGGSLYKSGAYIDIIRQCEVNSYGFGYLKSNVMSAPRAGLGGAVVDGSFYMIGGIDSYKGILFNTVEVLQSGYESHGALPINVKDFKTVELNGNIYMLGGQEYKNGGYITVRKVYEYNTINKEWKQRADFPSAVTNFSITSAYGKLYLLSGTSVYMYTPLVDSWSLVSTGTMTTTHAATLSGIVYAFRSGYNTAQKYDPLSNSWAALPNLPSGVAINSVQAMDGQVFVFASDRVMIYTPSTNTWRTNFCSFAYNNGIAAVYNTFYSLQSYSTAPGYMYFQTYLYKYNLTSDYWSYNAHGYFFNLCTANNKIYVFASTSGNAAAEILVEYMPPANPWIQVGGFSNSAFMGTQVIGNDIYIVGGYYSYLSNPSTGTSSEALTNALYLKNGIYGTSTKTPMTTKRAKLGFAEVGGKLYAFGGEVSMNSHSSNPGSATNKVEMYDPVTDTWTNKNNLPLSVHSMATATYNDKIYMFGGYGGGSLTYEYNHATDKWVSKANMPTGRYGGGAAVIGDKFYVVGGVGSKKVEAYDPVNNTWETKADLPEVRSYFGMTVADGKLYVIGGRDGYSDTSTVFEYDPALDRWFTWPGIHASVEGLGAVTLGDGILTLGGKSFYTYSSYWAGWYVGDGEFAPISSISTSAELIHLGSSLINPSGNLSRSYTDLSFDAPGFSVNVGRTYNSRDMRAGLISPGWTFSFESKIETDGNDTIVRMPDGSARSFKLESNGTYTAKDSRAKLVKSGSEHILTTKDHYTYGFNASGYLYYMEDPNGNRVTITFNGSNQVTGVTDQAGKSISISYSNSRISTITDSAGRSVVYGYTTIAGAARLTTVTDADGKYTEYTYDSTNGLLTGVNMSGEVLESFSYDIPAGETLAKVTSTTLPTGNTEMYTYDKVSGIVTTTSGDRVTITFFDKSLYPIQVIDAEGGEMRIEYALAGGINRYGEQRSVTDRNGNTTYYDRDANGNITRIVYSDMSIKEFTYDAYDNLKSETDERGNKTFYEYDANHNLTIKAKPLDGVTVYSTSANQNLFEVEKFTYFTQTGTYTIYGLLKTATDAAGNVLTYTYDSRGYVATVTDSLNRTTTYSYNIIGWLKSQTTPNQYTTTYYYDKAGRLLRSTASGSTTRFFYDAMGNMTASISPNIYSGKTDSAVFNGENIATTNTQHSSLTGVGFRYTYNKAGQVLTETNSVGNVTTYTYDNFGNLSTETKPNGSVYTYTYDKLNRPLTKSYKETSGSTAVLLESYAYAVMTDGTAKVTSTVYFSTSSTAVTVSTYDFAGRLVKRVNPDGGTVTNTYLPGGLLASVTDAMGGVGYYEYNARGLLLKKWSPITASTYSLTVYDYDKAGRLTKEERYVSALAKGATPSGDKVTKDYSYYIDGKVKDITTNSAAKTSYTYNNDGNLASEETLLSAGRSSRIEYTYNYLGKLATSKEYQERKDIDGLPDDTVLVPYTTTYAYDLNGNLTSITYPNSQAVSYQYDLLNRLTQESRNVRNESGVVQAVNRTSAYDNMGNITAEKNEKGYITSYTYTKRGFLASIIDPQNAVTAMEYDLQGRLIKKYSPRALIQDEPGHLVTPPAVNGSWPSPSGLTAVNYTGFSYDSMGRLLSKTEYYRPAYSSAVRAVAVETNTYDKNGNLLTSKDALNNTTTYTYDKANRLTKLTDAKGNQTQYAYNALGLQTHQTNARGVVTQNVYDLYGNVTKQLTAGQTVMSATYDYAGNMLTLTDGKGNTTTFSYTLSGKLRSSANAMGYTLRYWYDNMGRNTRALDSLNKQVVNSYDAWGRLLTVTQRHSNGSSAITVSTDYDVLGNPVYVTDERGNKTQYTYDKLSRVIAVKNPLNQTSAITYDANGNKVSESDWRGNTAEYRYDILDRLIAVIDPAGVQIETLTYTDTNRQAASTDALGHATSFAYDSLGQLIKTTDAEGYINSQTYDAVGNIATRTDGKGNVTSYAYDGFNRLTAVQDASGAVTSYTYDAAGNLLTQTDGEGNVTGYTYNALNLPALRTDAAGLAESCAYTADGKLSSKTDRNGVVSSYGYDIHGRLILETVGSAQTSYTYDNAGNQLTATDASGSIVRVYDALNRVTSKTVPQFGATTFAYDVTANLPSGYVGESTTVNGKTVLRVFDKCGRLAEVRDGSDTTTYAYYANGGLKTQTLPGGITANYTYFDNNRLKTLQNKQGNTILEAYQYAYDGAGNITAKQDVKGTTAYTYTALNQLLTVTEPSGRVTAYTYDGAYNRATETVTLNSETTVTTYSVNAQNRLTQTVTETTDSTVTERFYYDGNGNMLGRQPEALTDAQSGSGLPFLTLFGDPNAPDLTPALYSYNDKNQMVEAANGNTIVENGFNAEGYRASKTAGPLTTYFCYEYDRVIMELDSQSVAAYNVYGVNLISRDVGGDKVYYLYNGHGDVTGLVKANGTVVASYYYDAFGVILEETGSYQNPFRYSGYYFDSGIELYNLHARFYDAKLARFMQEDSYLGSQSDPLSLNLYTYCNNNPLVYWDPTGHYSVDDTVKYVAQKNDVSLDVALCMVQSDKGLGHNTYGTFDNVSSPATGSTPATTKNTGSSTSYDDGGGSGGGTTSATKNSGGLNGVTFGENEGADWLRTGSGLSFVEFWGVTPYGMAYAPSNGGGDNSGGTTVLPPTTDTAKNSDVIVLAVIVDGSAIKGEFTAYATSANTGGTISKSDVGPAGVRSVDGYGVRIRVSPGTNDVTSPTIMTVNKGTLLYFEGATVEKDGKTWGLVTWFDPDTEVYKGGWISLEYLPYVASPPASTPTTGNSVTTTPTPPANSNDNTGNNASDDTMFRWPFELEYNITSPFAPAREHPILGIVRAHKGMDIDATAGTKILAVADGIVSWVGVDPNGWGNYVKIYHDDTYSTLYAHCSSITVLNNQPVKAGDVIGYVGQTGLATGPHLHLELYENGTQIDPAPYIYYGTK